MKFKSLTESGYDSPKARSSGKSFQVLGPTTRKAELATVINSGGSSPQHLGGGHGPMLSAVAERSGRRPGKSAT